MTFNSCFGQSVTSTLKSNNISSESQIQDNTQKRKTKKSQETEDKIRQIISKELNIGIEKVKTGAKLNDDLGADSLNIVEIVLKIEKEFNITVPDEQLEQISTVGNVINLVNK